MDQFFGIPMNAVFAAALVMLACIAGAVGYVRWRRPILFEIGVRNIPRRPLQSGLIVAGLMLSTVIFSAALSVGDTVTYSITRDTYEKLGHVDEIVQVRSNTRKPSFEDEQLWPLGLLRAREVNGLIADFNADSRVDGVLPALRFPAPVTNRRSEITEPVAVVIGIDPDRTAGFEEDIALLDGTPMRVSDLQRAQILVNESLARKLDLASGDTVDVWIDSLPRTLRVVGVVRDRYLTGWTLDEPEGLVINLREASFLFGLPARAESGGANFSSFVAVSNAGGVRDAGQHTTSVTQTAIDSLRTSRVQVVPIKADRIDQAERTGANLTAMFIVLGLFTIAAGVLLIFLILVMLAAERRSEMGMSRAVGMKRAQLIESFMAEGMAYSVTAALAGSALGVAVSLIMTQAMQYIFSAADVDVQFHVELRSLVIAFALGITITFLTVLFSAWRVSRLSVVAAIRDVDEAPERRTGLAGRLTGSAAVAAGAAILVVGLQGGAAYQVGLGASVALMGAALTARSLGTRERPTFTAASLAVLLLWVLLAGNSLEALTGQLDAGLATFFVGGVLMVAAATVLIVFNAEILLAGMQAVGVLFARATPSVRTAVAYPLANKLRTGMTIAMLSLVVFALVMISTMSLNFRKLFLTESSRGGWDIEVVSQPTNGFPPVQENALGPLGEALDRALYDTRRIDIIGQAAASDPQRTEIRELLGDGELGKEHAFQIFGADARFLEENTIGLQARASGFADDASVWRALASDPSAAIIDGSAVRGINYANVRERRFQLDGYTSGETAFAPIEAQLTDSATGTEQTVRIIGIMDRGPSEIYRGLWMSEAGMAQVMPTLQVRYFVRLQPDLDATAEAAEMESALAEYGVSSDALADVLERQQSLSNAFFLLIQGFLAIGLGVGLVALTVIAYRTVVERRQQIGLLRAIGFTRGNVALAFVLETAFIAVLGIANGMWPALLLANRLLTSDEFSAAGFQSFHVPWLEIGLMTAGVFAAAVLTTVIPSRQASGIPPAEALRYE